MSTTEDNILVDGISLVRFLGWDVDEVDYYIVPNIGKVNPFLLKFHNDWNWLMMVVDKVEKSNLGTLEIQSKNLVIISYNGSTKKYYNDTLLLNTYNACVEFVKWYAKQVKTE